MGTAREGNDEEDEAPKEHQLQKLIKIAVDTPRGFFGGGPGKKLGQARMLRQKALARARQIRLRRMKLGKKNRAKMQRVMPGPKPAQVETVVKVDPPFMPHDVMEPVPVPGKRTRGENNGSSDLGVRESARGQVFRAIRDAALHRGAFGHWGVGSAKSHMRARAFVPSNGDLFCCRKRDPRHELVQPVQPRCRTGARTRRAWRSISAQSDADRVWANSARHPSDRKRLW